MLNWTPLSSAENTVFAEFDEDKILQKIDLAQFEQKFQLWRYRGTLLQRISRDQSISCLIARNALLPIYRIKRKSI